MLHLDQSELDRILTFPTLIDSLKLAFAGTWTTPLRQHHGMPGFDATGAEVSRALLAAVHNDPQIEVLEHALVLDALKNSDGVVCGVTLHVIGAGSRDGVGRAIGRAVVLATGGLGQVFAQTTNPSVSTGDGVALALRAGAKVSDVEFIQFHPTVLWLGDNTEGQQPLISEAVRGEGAYLVNDAGERFMQGQHEMAELAPRDVVAIAIMREMNRTGAHHVWLDVRHLTGFKERFPTIYASCIAHGIDPTSALIPVAPASHYASGGVRVDLDGRTSVKGLYACGETACSGVHGANRLASNSLLEGLVFSARIAADISNHLPEFSEAIENNSAEFLLDPSVRKIVAVARASSAKTISCSVFIFRKTLRLGSGAASAKQITGIAVRKPNSIIPRFWLPRIALICGPMLVIGARMQPAIASRAINSKWRESFIRGV